jgi:hypothetical protein
MNAKEQSNVFSILIPLVALEEYEKSMGSFMNVGDRSYTEIKEEHSKQILIGVENFKQKSMGDIQEF